MIEVCFGSFYFAFVIVLLMKNILDAIAYKYYFKKYKKHLMLSVLFDIFLIASLPLMMIMVSGVCK